MYPVKIGGGGHVPPQTDDSKRGGDVPPPGPPQRTAYDSYLRNKYLTKLGTYT